MSWLKRLNKTSLEICSSLDDGGAADWTGENLLGTLPAPPKEPERIRKRKKRRKKWRS